VIAANGTPALAQVQAAFPLSSDTLNGTASSSGAAVGLANVSGFVGHFSTGHFVQQYTSPASGLFNAGTFKFIYGQTFLLTFELSAASGTVVANGTEAVVCVFCAGSGTASSNFFNTFVLSGFEFLDPSGNPLPSPPTITSASGTQYSANGVLRSFNDFVLRKADVEDAGSFHVRGSFTLGPGSDGVDPLTEDVALQVGTFSAVIPAGSFKLKRTDMEQDTDQEEETERDGNRRFRFEGAINGVNLVVLIQEDERDRFRFSLAGQGGILTAAPGPFSVRLSIGDDGGSGIFIGDSD